MIGFTFRQTLGSGIVPYPFGLRGLSAPDGDGQVLYGATGSGGGVLTFGIGTDGVLTFERAVDFAFPLRTGTEPDVTVLDAEGVMAVAGSRALLAFDPVSGMPTGWLVDSAVPEPLVAAVSLGASTLIFADSGDRLYWGEVSAQGSLTIFASTISHGIRTLAATGPDTALGLDPAGNRVSTISVDPVAGMTVVPGPGAGDGIGWSIPHLVEVLHVGDGTFAVVGAAGSSSLTVLSVRGEGPPLPVDHIVDDLATRFEGVTALASLQAGTRSILAAAGGDDGVTLFELLANGRLVHLETLVESGGGTLAGVEALSLYRTGSTLSLVTATEGGMGVNRFAVPLGVLGSTLLGGAGDDQISGTARADVIFDGDGSDTLTGGAGADVFVFARDGRLDRVTDFEPGIDRLDLTAWNLLYDPALLSFASTATGARISFGTEVIEITTRDRTRLDRDDLQGADLLPLTRPPAAPIGRDLAGTAGDDVLPGGIGPDRISGGEGTDRLEGRESSDLLLGGGGGDILAGGDAADVLDGGAGEDRLDGGPGDDILLGGTGDDSLNGNAGDDLLVGGSGEDSLDGGNGDDTLRGGAGADHMWGSEGDDRLLPGMGDDLLSGGEGFDVFIFAPGTGRDRITDFGEGDRIDLTLLDLAETWDAFAVRLSHGDEGTLIDLGGGNAVLVEGVASGTLLPDDFLF